MNTGMDALYSQVEQTIRQHKEFLNVGNSVTGTEVRHAIRWVMRDNPDIFWFVHQYHFDKDNGIVSFRYRYFPERCAIIQESIDDVVMNDFQIDYVRTLSQREQVTYVYKWMLAIVTTIPTRHTIRISTVYLSGEILYVWDMPRLHNTSLSCWELNHVLCLDD